VTIACEITVGAQGGSSERFRHTDNIILRFGNCVLVAVRHA